MQSHQIGDVFTIYSTLLPIFVIFIISFNFILLLTYLFSSNLIIGYNLLHFLTRLDKFFKFFDDHYDYGAPLLNSFFRFCFLGFCFSIFNFQYSIFDFRFSIFNFDFQFSVFNFRFLIFNFQFPIFDFQFSIFDFRFSI